MNLFLDTNILIDLIADRLPFSNWAYKIFEAQKSKKWKLYTTSNSILTAYYVTEKEIGKNKALKIIKILLNRLEIEPIEKSVLIDSMSLKFKDYEDAVLNQSATKLKKIDYLVTRNKKDFKNSELKVVSPEELFIT